MNLIVGAILGAVLVVLGYYITRMRRATDDDNSHDTGQAIIDFSRAFPTEAIRSLHMTKNGKAVFVRLHDNKAGFMRNMGSHYACMLIAPGSLRIEHLPTGDCFAIQFADAPKHSGEFRFPSASEAADVSLWLLGSFVEEEKKHPIEEDAAPAIRHDTAEPSPSV